MQVVVLYRMQDSRVHFATPALCEQQRTSPPELDLCQVSKKMLSAPTLVWSGQVLNTTEWWQRRDARASN